MKMKRVYFYAMMMLVAFQGFSITTYAQASRETQGAKTTIMGVVTDTEKAPLPGVVVWLKQTAKKVVTDRNGRFALPVEEKMDHPVLVFSYIGMKTREVSYTGGVVNVMLDYDINVLEDVVVTGYQSIAREKSTGAVTAISADALEDRYTPSLSANLEGRVAGLTIYDGQMTIRGASSLYASTAPLLVVDGLPVEGSLDDINPYDVESVTVLKDASASAIYGARASNGIIVVTTKRARNHGRVSVDVSANFTVYQKRNLDYADNFYMTPEQQIKAEQEYYHYYFFDNNGEVTDPIGSTENAINTSSGMGITQVQYAYYQLAKGEITEAELNRQLDVLKKNNFAKEYADHVLLNRFLQQYNVALRSRSDKFQSNLVVNYRHDNSGIREAGSDQFTVFYKGTYDMVPWLTANFSVNGIIGKSTQSNSTYTTNPFNVSPYTRLLKEDGSYAYYSPPASYYSLYNTMAEENPALRSMNFNHLEELSYDQTKSDRRSTRYHGELLFKVSPDLTANTQFIYETERQTERSYAEAESYIMRLMRNVYTVREGAAPDYTYRYMIPENGGKLATTNTWAENWTARGQLNFNREVGKHAVNLIAGLEFRETKSGGTHGLLLGYDEQLQSNATVSVNIPELYNYQRTTFFMRGYTTRGLYDTNIARAIGPVIEQFHRYASGYANATYTFNNRYNAFGSFRKDYADVYGLDTKFRGKPLWSIGANWNIHNEEFMEGIGDVNFLQFRLSYGITGNIYQGATSHLTATSSLFNYTTKLPRSVVNSPANLELKWEETATTNVGLDFRLFNYRLRGSLDYYHKKGTDVFSRKTLDPSKGFTSIAMNLASLKNNGVEVTLGYDWFKSEQPTGFSWNTLLTASFNKNEITRVEVQATRAYQLLSEPFQVGYPVNALFSYRFAGIDAAGQPTWYDDNEKSVRAAQDAGIDALVYSGQSDPKTVLSMENQFKYKGVSLNVLAVYYGGHQMRARQAQPTLGMPYLIPDYFVNAWTPENTDTNVPGIGRYSTSSIGNETTYTDIYVHPADFLKIRNIVLGYDLPASLLSRIGLHDAVLRFQLDNPKYLWVKNKVGVDPETRSLRTPSSYILGINFNF